jgi:hypothetical protein
MIIFNYVKDIILTYFEGIRPLFKHTRKRIQD